MLTSLFGGHPCRSHAEVVFFYFSLILSKDHWLVLQCIAGAAQRRVGRIEVG